MSPEILPGPLAPTVAEAGPGPPPRPKLRRSERVPDPGRWATVIPPLLAEQVADSEWTEVAYEQWRGRVWAKVLDDVGLPYQRPYDLRHSCASLLLHEGRSVIYVARQLGHGAALTMRTYGHVIDELEDQPRISAEDAIAAARGGAGVRTKFGRGG